MPERNLGALLAAARSRVGGARGMLERPRSCRLDECVTLLREAQGYLEWLRDSLPAARTGGAELRAGALALATELAHAGVLLDQAARRGRRWLERLESGAGYTATGALPAWQGRGRISMLG